MEIFVNCARNDETSDNKFARQLLHAVFTDDEICNDTLSGKTRGSGSNVKQLCPEKVAAIQQLWYTRFSIIEKDGKAISLDRKVHKQFQSVIQNRMNHLKKLKKGNKTPGSRQKRVSTLTTTASTAATAPAASSEISTIEIAPDTSNIAATTEE